MCGIAGAFAYRQDAPGAGRFGRPAAGGVDRDELIKIRDHKINRGPDGAQPMATADGRQRYSMNEANR